MWEDKIRVSHATLDHNRWIKRSVCLTQTIRHTSSQKQRTKKFIFQYFKRKVIKQKD